MRVVITGAAGFVGSGLARYLCEHPDALGRPISRLVLADLAGNETDQAQQHPNGVEWRFGDLTNAAYLDSLLVEPVDCFFHLASLPGAVAETKPELGWSVNLCAPMALADRLARQGRKSGRAPRIVFASSIAVYGPLGASRANEHQVPHPAMSYGAHKLATEILLADLSRRGDIDARSLRLPGIVARPASESGHGSAFMSMLFHKAAAGEAYVCLVSAEATCWWMSLATCVANLCHAAKLETNAVPLSRIWQLPVLHASVGEILGAIANRLGPESTSRFRFERDEAVEARFGRFPDLAAPDAIAAGFVADAHPRALVTSIFGE
jgi:nucleoside-diphosphate-sugar epimerase